jgi:hypothetical protein
MQFSLLPEGFSIIVIMVFLALHGVNFYAIVSGFV